MARAKQTASKSPKNRKNEQKQPKSRTKNEGFRTFCNILFASGHDKKPALVIEQMRDAGYPISESTFRRWRDKIVESNRDFRSYLARQGWQSKTQDMLTRMDVMNEKAYELWTAHYENAKNAGPDISYTLAILRQAAKASDDPGRLEAEIANLEQLVRTAGINLTIQRLAVLEGKMMDRWAAQTQLATGVPLLDELQRLTEGEVEA